MASFSKLVGALTGMYVVYVLAVGSSARSFTTNLVTQIPHADLSSTHRLAALCADIYAAEGAGVVLEERLYWLLIRVPVAGGAVRVHEDQGGPSPSALEEKRIESFPGGERRPRRGARRSRKDDRSKSKDRRIGDGGDGGDGGDRLRRRAGRTDATE